MGLQDGLPWGWILRWTFEQMLQEPGLRHVRLDEAMEQIFFTVHGKGLLERRYRLSIEHGGPKIDQVEGPDESIS
jgi:hypothetical protein